MKQAQYLTKDSNLMDIAVRGVELTPFLNKAMPFYVEMGMNVKISGYNLEGVLIAILEDYGIQKVVDEINNLRTDSEPPIVYDVNQKI